MLVAETKFKHQVEVDINRSRRLCWACSSITIGMKLDWRPVLDLAVVGALRACRCRFRAELWYRAGALCSAPTGGRSQAVPRRRPAIQLRAAQQLARKTTSCRRHLNSPMLAAMVLSMLATPFIVHCHHHRDIIISCRATWLLQSVAAATIAKPHNVIICSWAQ